MKVTPNSNRRRADGFTLIELLTVIAIIGILAAIIIPTVGAVREKAKATQCASNIRQWGAAIQLYAAENKNRYAVMERIYTTNAPTGKNQWWFQVATNASETLYGRYFSASRGVYPSCPGQTGDGDGTDSSLKATHFLMTRPSQTVGSSPITAQNRFDMTQISTPSKFVLMVERAFVSNNSVDNPVAGADYEDLQVKNSNARTNADGFLRHSNKMNTLWADGHVSQTNSDDWKATASAGSGFGSSSTYNYQLWTALR